MQITAKLISLAIGKMYQRQVSQLLREGQKAYQIMLQRMASFNCG